MAYEKKYSQITNIKTYILIGKKKLKTIHSEYKNITHDCYVCE